MRNNEEYGLDSAWPNDASDFDADVEATRCLGARPRTPGFRTADQLEADINGALACADMAQTPSIPEALEIAIQKLDHVLSAGAGALGIDEVKIITEHRDDLAANLRTLRRAEQKCLSPARDLLQATNSTQWL